MMPSGQLQDQTKQTASSPFLFKVQKNKRQSLHTHLAFRPLLLVILLCFMPTSSYAAIITGVAVVSGGSIISSSTNIQITGSDLGSSVDDTVVVKYGDDGTKYTTGACTKSSDGTSLQCPTIDGVGTNLGFTVTVNGGTASTISTDKFAYALPTISGVSNEISSTTGGTVITITGTNLGPANHNDASASYGPSSSEFSVSSCTVNGPTEMECTTVAGIGKDLKWKINIGDQSSGIFTDTLTRYGNPTVSSIALTSDSVVSVAAPFSTVDIVGTNFGPSGTPSITYGGSDGLKYAPSSCTMVTPHTKIRCPTVAGYGKDLKFIVTVASQSSTLRSSTVDYAAPTITGLSTAVFSTTEGGDVQTITGTGFGATSHTDISATYGSFTATPCSWVSATSIQCTTVAGKGNNLRWILTVGDQLSSAFSGTITRYASPTITSIVKTSGSGSLSTSGGTTVDISGDNFGPSGTPSITYGGSDGLQYSISSCTMVTPHEKIRCTTVAGVGQNLKWIVTVATQASNIFTSTVDYDAPTLSALSGAAFAGSSTTHGGVTIVLAGTNFGPSTHTNFFVKYGPSGNVVKYTASCQPVVSQIKIICTTTEGVGTDLKWQITVGEQASGISTDGTTYTTPTLTGLSGTAVTTPSTTEGGVSIILNGDFFGPNGDATPDVTYGRDRAGNLDDTDREYTASGCVVNSQTQITCNTGVGVGAGLKWQVRFEATVVSLVLESSTTSYADPSITGASAIGSSTILTVGSSSSMSVTLTGNDFGPTCTGCVVGKYGPTAGTKYGDVTCNVITGHKIVQCPTVAGVGAGQKWIVTRQSLSSLVSSATVDYTPPSISSLSGVAADSASTTLGNEAIVIDGANFGPAGHNDGLQVVYGRDSQQQRYTATGCTIVSQTKINCNTAPGIGFSLKWIVTVASQISGRSSDATAYLEPLLTGLSGAAVDGTSPSNGGMAITLTGNYFGPDGNDPNDVTVKYGRAGNLNEYTARSCSVVSQTTINCETNDGVGLDLKWKVVIGGQQTTSLTTPMTTYALPTITGLSGDAVNTPSVTQGGVQLIIDGTNFGPVTNNLVAAYYGRYASPCKVKAGGTNSDCASATADATTCAAVTTSGGSGNAANACVFEYTTASCTVQSHTQIRCNTGPGVGDNLKWYVNIGYQDSSVFETITTRYANPHITGAAVAVGTTMNTDGTSRVAISGINFGSTCTGCVVGKYGPTSGTKYSVLCDVTTSDTRLNCATTEGLGADHKWIVTRQSLSSTPSVQTVSYTPPEITSFTGTTTLSTSGGTELTITGTNFGPVGNTEASATYGPAGGETKYVISGCTVESDSGNVVMKCTTIAGVGGNLKIQLTVAGQTGSIGPTNVYLNYEAPTLTSLSGLATGVSGSTTVGGISITLTGQNFGPIRNNDVVVTYGPNTCIVTNTGTNNDCATATADASACAAATTSGGSGIAANACVFDGTNKNEYTALECQVVVADTEITCKTSVGIGKDLNWKIHLPTLGDLSSAASTQTTKYAIPLINSILGDSLMNTVGGQTYSLSGGNFGPIGTVVVGKYISGSDEYVAVNCVVIEAHVKIECVTVRGEGINFKWKLTIGKQDSLESTDSFSYHKPSVLSVSPNNGIRTGGAALVVRGINFGLTPVIYIGTLMCSADQDDYTDGTFGLNGDHTMIKCNANHGPKSTITPLETVNSIVDVGQAGNSFVKVQAGGQDSEEEDSSIFSFTKMVSYTPSVGCVKGGTKITVTGENFVSPQVGSMAVYFDLKLQESPEHISSTAMSFMTVQSTDGVTPITVTTLKVRLNKVQNPFFAGQYEEVPTGSFVYYKLPTNDQLPFPRAGPSSGNSKITFTGTFHDTNSVNARFTAIGSGIDDVTTDCNYISSTSVECQTPKYSGGDTSSQLVQVHVSVDNPLTQMTPRCYSNPVNYYYYPSEPVLSGVKPTGLDMSAYSQSELVNVSVVIDLPQSDPSLRYFYSTQPNTCIPASANSACSSISVPSNQATCDPQSVGTCAGGSASDCTGVSAGPEATCIGTDDGGGNACAWTSTNLCMYFAGGTLPVHMAIGGNLVEFIEQTVYKTTVTIDVADITGSTTQTRIVLNTLQMTDVGESCEKLSIWQTAKVGGALVELPRYVLPGTCGTASTIVWVQINFELEDGHAISGQRRRLSSETSSIDIFMSNSLFVSDSLKSRSFVFENYQDFYAVPQITAWVLPGSSSFEYMFDNNWQFKGNPDYMVAARMSAKILPTKLVQNFAAGKKKVEQRTVL